MTSTGIFILLALIFIVNLIVAYRYSKRCSNSKSFKIESIQNDLMNCQNELEVYRAFTEEVRIYIGSYPNWKVQNEYRELLVAIRKGNVEHYKWHLHNIDAYLTKLSKATEKLPGTDRNRIITSDNDLLKKIEELYPESEKFHIN